MMNGGDSVPEILDNKSGGNGGGVEDLYGEDTATVDQLVTPWTVSVARSVMSDDTQKSCF